MVTVSGRLSPFPGSIDISDLAVSSWEHALRRIAKLSRRLLRHHPDRLLRDSIISARELDELGSTPLPAAVSSSRMPSRSDRPHSRDRDGIKLFEELLAE